MVTPPGKTEPVPGAIELTAETDTHKDTRTVFFHDFELASVRFPALEGTSEVQLSQIVRSIFPEQPVAVSPAPRAVTAQVRPLRGVGLDVAPFGGSACRQIRPRLEPAPSRRTGSAREFCRHLLKKELLT